MGASIRVSRFERAVRDVVGLYVANEAKGYLKNFVTVQRVEMPPDLKSARVYCSFFGHDESVIGDLKVLQGEAQRLQKILARSLKSRHTPRLEFLVDHGIEYMFKIEEKLRAIRAEQH